MKIYNNFILDSTRWNEVKFRDDDIVVVTPYKSGTTWMQYIVMHLIIPKRKHFDLSSYSSWIEEKTKPIETVLNNIEQQAHRRCFKSHLPADGIPIVDTVKYIFVGRDPRDVFMSLWNQYSNYTDDFYSMVNKDGNTLPQCPADIKELWNKWLTLGTSEYDTEGWPHWTNLRHIQTWWDANKEHSNVMLIHYSDLIKDLDGGIAKVADFLNIKEYKDNISELTSFTEMKRNADIILPKSAKTYKKGNETFFNTGTNNKWIDVLNSADLELYDRVSKSILSEECKEWIEQ